MPADHPPANLARLLEARAEVLGDRPSFAWSNTGETEDRRLGFTELAAAARRMAADLASVAQPGEPVLICLPQGLDYVVALFACSYAGVLSVPVYPPEAERGERMLPRLRAIVDDAAARAVITTAAFRPALGGMLGDAVRILAVEETADGADGPHPGLDADPDAGAVLMYTSGSTGSPKGIVLTHRNLLYNLEHFPGFRNRPVETVVSWLPFFHDLGLMLALLHPVYRGALSVVFPPLAFVQRPLRWLELASRHRATTLGGPNFAFGLCAHRAAGGAEFREPVDLSSINLVLNGAEPVRRETVERFTEVFAPHGFRHEAWYPSYGLADAAATVSGGIDPEPPKMLALGRRALGRREIETVGPDHPADDVVDLVGCGVTVHGQEIAIVDPETGRRSSPGAVGEVWVAGPSTGIAVWRNPEETERRCRARLDDRPGTSFLRTGDLGFLDDDGELYLVGRLSDMIILRGVNHFPEDLEPTVVAAHAACRPGCSVAVPVEWSGEERVGVIQEVSLRAPADEVVAAIRSALRRDHDVDPAVVCLIRPGTLPKTSSGKVRRRAALAAWRAGDLEVLAEWTAEAAPDPATPAPPPPPPPAPATAEPASTETVLGWLTDHLARRLGLAPAEVDPRRPLADLGLPSLEAVTMVGELAEWLGRPLEPTLAWRYPTLEALARSLTGEGSGPATVPAAADWDRPVAVVGMSCRVPGADGVDAFWELLREGRDGVTEVPPERWDARALYDHDPATPGRCVSRWGGFLSDLDLFDADFFAITPREAFHLDPRQRILLELTYEALEHAGIPAADLAGSATGVFVANLSNDYDQLLYGDLRRVDAYSGTGTANSVVANRLSYLFDLQGPSVAVDTACSGSLVAVHMAAQALAAGDCDLALAGGVSVNLLPNGNIFFSRAGALSPTGRCRPFSRGADGIVRSEGAGLVVLKPLEAALADGDRVLAVLRGSAVNQDGRSNGMMAPNGQAQEAVLRRAYRRAGVEPSRVGFVEAHGTGTHLGDPIEATALGAVLATGREDGAPAWLGSLKSNLGHMEAAAGVVGLIKAVLCLRHGEVPPNLHFDEPNPLIDFAALPLRVPTRCEAWPAPDGLRLAGVSSFGFGGTNAHAILEEWRPAAPAESKTAGSAAGRCPVLIPLSARSPAALEARRKGWARYLRDRPDLDPAAVAATAALRRDHHRHRACVLAGDLEAAAEALERGEGASGFRRGEARRDERLVFAFSGQGTDRAGMGRELMASEPAFRDTVAEVAEVVEKVLGVDLVEVLAGDAPIPPPAVQPAIFAVQAGVVGMLAEWGIEPDAVVGQSLGEITAAWAGGALPLAAAARVVAHRARLMLRTAGQGATAVVGLPRREAELALAGFAGSVAVAGVSGPRTTVVSGPVEEVERLVAGLAAREVFARRLETVDTAFHSPLMDPLVPELVASLEGLEARSEGLPILSTVDGDWRDGEGFDAAHWGRNLRQPFLLAPALSVLLEAGYGTVVEIGPHPVLGAALRQVAEAADRPIHVVATLHRDRSPRESLLSVVGDLYVRGHDPAWEVLHPRPVVPEDLPSYPWQRERYWFDQVEVAGAAPALARRRRSSHQPWLEPGVANAARPRETIHVAELGLDRQPMLGEHRIEGVAFVPGAAWVDLMLGAVADRTAGEWGRALRDVEFHHPLVLRHERTVAMQVVVDDEGGDGTLRVRVYSAAAAGGPADAGDGEGAASRVPHRWVLHAAARAVREVAAAPQPAVEAAIRRLDEVHPARELYEEMADRGLQYGGAFRSVRHIRRGDGEAVGHLEVPPEVAADLATHPVHPAVLDAAFQVMAHAHGEVEGEGAAERLFLPVGIDSVELLAPLPERLRVHARLREASSADVRRADLQVEGVDGTPVARLRGLAVQRLGTTAARGDEPRRDALFEVRWETAPRRPFAADGAAAAGRWVFLMDRHGVGEALAGALERCGGQVHRLWPVGSDGVTPDGDGRTVDAGQPEAVEATLVELAAAGDGPLRGVVHLWGIDDATDAEADGAAQRLSATFGDLLGSVFGVARGFAELRRRQVIQALTRAGWAEAPRLWMVTRAAQRDASRGGPASLAAASLWGVSRVFAQEDPDSWGAILDLDLDLSAAEAATFLLPEILDRDGEDHVAFVPERRVQRLVEAGLVADRPDVSLRPDATYLVAGGLGGLGSEAARWLVARGARRLLLLARRELPDRDRWAELPADHPDQARLQVVRDLEAAGAAVHCAFCDLADGEGLDRLLGRFRRQGRPPIRGVVHAAGILDDRLLTGSDVESALQVAAPKVVGSLQLHRLLGDDLDFFVLFSSVASTVGTLGEASYAAANAVQHALAEHRLAGGSTALTLDWGPWSEVGMAARHGLEEQHLSQGMGALAPAEARRILDLVWNGTPRRVLAMAVDWPGWCRAVTYVPPLVARFSGGGRAEGATEDDAVVARLAALPEEQRGDALVAHLRDEVAGVLRLDPLRVPMDEPLGALGVDSIMMADIKRRVDAALGVSVAITELLTASSLEALAATLLPRLASADGGEPILKPVLQGSSRDDRSGDPGR